MKENKRKPWIVLALVCFMSAGNLGLLMNSIGVFYTPVSTGLGVSKASLTLYVTIGSLVSAFAALSVAKIAKRFNIKLVIAFGAICSCGATFLMGFCQELWQFYLLGAIRGLGLNFFSMIIMTMIINKWFVVKHGFATSLVMSFGGIAGAIGSPMLTSFITNLGWQNAYRLYGTIAFLLCTPILLYPFKLDPKEEGLLPYGYTQSNTQEVKKASSKKRKIPLIPFIVFCIVAISVIGLANMPQHFPGYAITLGYTASVGALMLSASMIGNISSKVIFGILSDKIGSFYTSITILAMNLCSIFLFLIFKNDTLLIACSFLYGMTYSMSSVGNALLCKDFFGLENYNTVYPKVTFATGISGAIFATVLSMIYDATGGYTAAFLLMIALHVMIFISLLFLSSKRKKGEIG